MNLFGLTATFEFWLPWKFGYGSGWGAAWFDFGPFTIYWGREDG